MAYLVNAKKTINETVFKHEERLNSQYARFLNSAPALVDYFSINSVESTVDNGFQNVERILGDHSPLLFKEIKDLPVYGMDQILLDLGDTDHGLDVDFSGDLVIPPGTVDPKPDDIFIIKHLKSHYLFRVTEVAYDSIKSNNFYKISFVLRSIDEEDRQKLEKQTNERYTCIYENIGTVDKCIIKDDEIHLIATLDKVYTQIADMYMSLFYNKRYNVFLVSNEVHLKIYDKFLSEFINRTGIFNRKHDFMTLILNIEDIDNTFPLEYRRSFYSFLERDRPTLDQSVSYGLKDIQDRGSVFNFYRDSNVRSVMVNKGSEDYVPTDFTTSVNNKVFDSENVVWNIIAKHMHSKIENPSDLQLDTLEEFSDFIDYNFESYIMVPILLHVLRRNYNKFMLRE